MGGGIGMGNTCKPRAVLFQCMTKFTTNKKKKKMNMNLSKLREIVKDREVWCAAIHRVAKSRTRLSD